MASNKKFNELYFVIRVAFLHPNVSVKSSELTPTLTAFLCHPFNWLNVKFVTIYFATQAYRKVTYHFVTTAHDAYSIMWQFWLFGLLMA